MVLLSKLNKSINQVPRHMIRMPASKNTTNELAWQMRLHMTLLLNQPTMSQLAQHRPNCKAQLCYYSRLPYKGA